MIKLVVVDRSSTCARSTVLKRVLIGTWTAPIFARANIAKIHSGQLISQSATFSPGRTPAPISPRATRSTSAAIWRNV